MSPVLIGLDVGKVIPRIDNELTRKCSTLVSSMLAKATIDNLKEFSADHFGKSYAGRTRFHITLGTYPEFIDIPGAIYYKQMLVIPPEYVSWVELKNSTSVKFIGLHIKNEFLAERQWMYAQLFKKASSSRPIPHITMKKMPHGETLPTLKPITFPLVIRGELTSPVIDDSRRRNLPEYNRNHAQNIRLDNFWRRKRAELRAREG